MKPLLTYLKDLFASRRIVGEDRPLQGLLQADTLLRSLISEKKVPGLAITVLKHGQTVFQQGYGHTDLDRGSPVDPRKTIFRIASVSKPIAATALARLVAEGIIDLDASFYTYVPYYPAKGYDFTIRQLAGHTAGIRSYRGKEYALNEAYSIKEGISVFKDDELLFEPGTDYHYNSYDWALISLAIEEACQQHFEAVVGHRVLQPLGMAHTFPELSGDSTPLGTVFYSKNSRGFRKAVPVDNFYKLAGGGYLSTSEDIAKLGQAYLDRAIADTSVISEFLSSVTINGEPTYYGLGWEVSMDKKGRTYYGHVGNGVGGYSNFFVYPEHGTVISILINCTDPKVQEPLDEIIDLILEAV